ncbi:c-type cytochrome [Maribacter confluentis]|uniref:C-type cytochrome n=1 Tax=Maribacter confluentis TaxID=1656093 RepID=A0ABT8RSG5_9FLAO|nr:c-type cytochrome [Maribacter confluentis]MDO1513866.1 c-type cytochrome [Maribacter confluentis]
MILSCKDNFSETEVPLDHYKLEAGFELEVVAAEPLLKAPVAMDFDAKGRIWVAQMPGYMSDMQGSEEDEPIGSIRILEDLDEDGIADHSKIFMDSIVMPRALAHVYGGLLYAVPPNLWFVEIKDDKPVNKVLVDSIYAVEGNPEHQPNALELNIDNWIYNAKSNFRYRRHKGKWLKEPTTFRGQWGMTHDNFGRLYYNDNSRILLGDYVLPNTLINNAYFTPKASVDKLLTTDQRVYPVHATSVNRGYAKGVLNADSILVNATAACSPLVYRGGSFPKDYEENVFVCIPEGNLIKRTLLNFKGDSVIAKHAWENKEFLTSTDEGFRPVSLKNGPDGSMYVVDMHRGMIGHHAYLSPYLKEKTKTTRIDTIVDFGRILKIKHQNDETTLITDFNTLSATELVSLLTHKNGYIRDRAQHYLIYKELTQVTDEVKDLAINSKDRLGQLHALYVLEGWSALSFDILTNVMENAHTDVAAHALVLSKKYVSAEYIDSAAAIFKSIGSRKNITLDVYLGNALGPWMTLEEDKFKPIFLEVLKRRQDNATVTEALLSGLTNIDSLMYANIMASGELRESAFAHKLGKSLENKRNGKLNAVYTRKTINEDNRTSGAKMFYQICASCHGANGQGIEGLAPPLMGSEHVENVERLALIILHGLEGPVHVKGEEYNLNLAMPGLIRNENITDKDIADIISYVSNAFSDEPKSLQRKRIGELREVKSKTGMEFTEEELKALDD